MTPKTSCTLIPNRDFLLLSESVFSSFRVSILLSPISLFLWLSRFDRRLFIEKVTGIINGTPPLWFIY